MRYLVLGRLEVHTESGSIAIGGPKERRLLAMLVSRRAETVSVDALIDGLWDGSPPRTAAKTLQSYIVHVRHALAKGNGASPTSIVTESSGYSLQVPVEDVDADRFGLLVERGRAAADAGDQRTAKVLLHEALTMWRGAAYEDFPGVEFLDVERRRLDELRVSCLEARIDADLAMGMGSDLIPDLEAAVAVHSTRERFWAQLMHALYRSGRQADALATFHRARDLLRDELGIEPGEQLRSMQAAVFAQDPRLMSVAAWDWQPMPPGLGLPASSCEGRDEDLRWLRQHWVEAIAGRGSVVVVSGPEGIGKSRLLAEFGAEVHKQGAVVTYGALTRAPSPDALVTAAAGRPVLALLDEPLTSLAASKAEGLPLLVVAALNPSTASRHVRAGFLGSDHRELEPLSETSARRVVEGHAEAGEPAIDVADVLRLSGGVPAKLHELAAAAVETAALGRIGDAAEASGAARAGLSVVRANLRGEILGLQRERAKRTARMSSTPGSLRYHPLERCPYKGLAVFGREDSAVFHGRDALVAALLARVADTSFVPLIGASGSGKSSLVRAGLLASLADGSLPGSSTWPQRLLHPGQPLPSAESDPMVVVVDQFEEVWTTLGPEARVRFLDEVVALSRAGHHVVVTLRADYLDRCTEHPDLTGLVAEGTVLVGQMTDAEIRRAVVGPAEAAGLTVEPGLVDAVVSDVHAQPGALPLMSAALADTWEARSGRRISLAAYARSGGVGGAVARVAEAAYGSLADEEKAAARRLFLRLATADDDVLVRRRVPIRELDRDPAATRGLDVMSARRLLTVDHGAVEVAHEVLFTAWPRLEGWLAEDKQGRALRRHLAPAAMDWEAGGRAPADLYRGVRLNALLEWVRDHWDDLTRLESEFVDESAAEADRELSAQHERADREARGRRRLLLLTGALSLSLVAAGVTALVAVDQRQQIDDVAERAVARQLGSSALLERSLDRSLLLAAAAVRVDDSTETRANLLASLQRSPEALRVLRGDAPELTGVEISADSGTVIAGGGGTVSTWDTNAVGKSDVSVRATKWGFVDIAARPGTDEVMLSSLVAAGTQVPFLIRWDVSDQEQIGSPLSGATKPLGPLAWSADGRYLAGNQDVGDVLVWDFEHLNRPPVHIPTNHDRFRTLASAGGKRFILVEQTGQASVWRLGVARPDLRFDVGADVSSMASTPDGSIAAIGHADGRTALWDTATGRHLQRLASHASAVPAVVFDQRGESVATLGDDGEVMVSDVSSGALVKTLSGHSGAVTGGAFTANGRTLYTSSLDGSVIAWDLTGARGLGAYFPGSRGTESTSMIVSSAGVVAQTRPTGAVRFWDAESGQPLGAAVRGDQGPIIDGAFSPDGSELATAAIGGTVQLWDPATRTPGQMIRGLPGDANEIRYSPDGRHLAVCVWHEGGGTVHVFDTDTDEQVGEAIDVGWGMTQLAWSPDSTAFAVASWEVPDVRVYDLETREQTWSQQVHASAASLSVAWSPDGGRVATGDELGRLRFWDASTGQPEGPPLAGHTGSIATTAFSPDGALIVTSGDDGKAILRDATTSTQLGLPLPASDGHFTIARFDAEGRLFVASDDGAIWRWDVSVDSWLSRACTVAGRELGRSEWANLDTGLDYQPACG